VVLLGSQSRAFRTLHSAFYFPRYAFRISAFYRYPNFSSCRLTDLELTARNSRFGVGTAPIEKFSGKI